MRCSKQTGSGSRSLSMIRNAVQGGSKMAGSKLTFAPLCYVGCGAAIRLPEEVQKYRANRVLLIADPILVSLGTVDLIAGPLKDQGCCGRVWPRRFLQLGGSISRRGRLRSVLRF